MPADEENTDIEQRGDPSDFDAAYDAIYEDLRRRASALRRGNPNLTVLTTEIVNEAYVNLRSSEGLRWTEIPHLKRIVSKAMRHLMVDLARKRQAERRGGKDPVRVPIDDVQVPQQQSLEAEAVLDINRALGELAEASPRQASILELKYFGGLTNKETADELGMSESTLLRDVRVAEAWLSTRLQKSNAAE